MPELGDRLTALTPALDWPPTPDLAPAVMENVQVRIVPIPARSGRPRWRTRWALAAAAVLLIVATLLAYTPTREVIAGWLNLHTTINRVQTLPTPSPLPSGPLGKRLGLGDPTTLAAAQSQTSWKILVPSSLGAPDEVYVQEPSIAPSAGEVTLVYAQRHDIPVSGFTGVSVLVTQARGRVDEVYFQKTLSDDVKIEAVTIGGHAGYWISGHPHTFVITDPSGEPYPETLRLATNTLILDDNGTIVRIEGQMTRDKAIKIASSLG